MAHKTYVTCIETGQLKICRKNYRLIIILIR